MFRELPYYLFYLNPDENQDSELFYFNIGTLMSKKPCPVEPLITSQYCQLSVCMECNMVNLSLPGRITIQFETHHFFDIANTFNKAAQILKAKKAPKQQSAVIIKLNNLH